MAHNQETAGSSHQRLPHQEIKTGSRLGTHPGLLWTKAKTWGWKDSRNCHTHTGRAGEVKVLLQDACQQTSVQSNSLTRVAKKSELHHPARLSVHLYIQAPIIFQGRDRLSNPILLALPIPHEFLNRLACRGQPSWLMLIGIVVRIPSNRVRTAGRDLSTTILFVLHQSPGTCMHPATRFRCVDERSYAETMVQPCTALHGSSVPPSSLE